MSGHWPPEWDDPEEEFTAAADQPDAAVEARLSEVTAYLASVPAPAMPDAVQARISAALAAEAATRTDHADQADHAGDARKPRPSRARARAGRHRDSRRPGRGFRLRPQVAAASVVGCLLLAAAGYGLSQANFNGSTSSSASGSRAGNAASAGSAASSAAGAAGGGVAPGEAPSAPGPGAQYNGTSSSFAVTESGTRYQRATLAGQVRAKLTLNGGHETSGHTAPAASAPAASAVPSAALRGCVLRLTNGAQPRLVDRATYQGEPAYVIAGSSQVWVVGLGCTAAKTELIVSVPLAG
jgi:hypothetical protein